MRKKLLSTTYLRDVRKYEIKFDLSNDDYYLCVKHFVDCDAFVVSNGTKLMDNDYYMLELIPKNENYSMRVYFDENKEIISYYFDISLENGLDKDTKIPYYDDLYVDITIFKDKIEVIDENELMEAYQDGLITKEQFDLANTTAAKLLNELKENKNRYKNLDLKKML